jgi:hypothetical protein
VAIADIFTAAAAADDYDSARVIAAFMNAEAMKESARGRDPAGWTDTRVLALGRMFAEVFREQRSAPTPVVRPVMPITNVEIVDTLAAQRPARAAPVDNENDFTAHAAGDVGQAAVTEALRVVANGDGHGVE